jgi:hypothetical protein
VTGQWCRKLVHTITVVRQTHSGSGTACRGDEGKGISYNKAGARKASATETLRRSCARPTSQGRNRCVLAAAHKELEGAGRGACDGGSAHPRSSNAPVRPTRATRDQGVMMPSSSVRRGWGGGCGFVDFRGRLHRLIVLMMSMGARRSARLRVLLCLHHPFALDCSCPRMRAKAVCRCPAV